MRPEKVFSWREQLPPPFDKPTPVLKRRASAARLEVPFIPDSGVEDLRKIICQRRRNSAPGALDQTDRRVAWLRFIRSQYKTIQREKSTLAIEKLKRYLQ
jgi:hypothetical protein